MREINTQISLGIYFAGSGSGTRFESCFFPALKSACLQQAGGNREITPILICESAAAEWLFVWLPAPSPLGRVREGLVFLKFIQLLINLIRSLIEYFLVHVKNPDDTGL
jgi:hypothetical protein